MAIERTLHQIWIGKKPEPVRWTKAWKDLPGWDYQLWDHEQITDLLVSHYPGLLPLYRRYIGDESMNGAANIARVAILHRHGGVYIDTDTELLKNFWDADFMHGDGFVVHSPNVQPHDDRPSRLVNGMMGFTKGHSFMAAYARALEKANPSLLHPSWRRTGAELMTEVFNRRRKKDITVLPAHTFLPKNMQGKRVGPDMYGIHHYGTTNRLYK